MKISNFKLLIKKAFDLAVKENNTAAVNILNAHVGGTMIDAYLKTKSNDIKP